MSKRRNSSLLLLLLPPRYLVFASLFSVLSQHRISASQYCVRRDLWGVHRHFISLVIGICRPVKMPGWYRYVTPVFRPAPLPRLSFVPSSLPLSSPTTPVQILLHTLFLSVACRPLQISQVLFWVGGQLKKRGWLGGWCSCYRKRNGVGEMEVLLLGRVLWMMSFSALTVSSGKLPACWTKPLSSIPWRCTYRCLPAVWTCALFLLQIRQKNFLGMNDYYIIII